MKTTIISGSARQDNNTLRVAKAIEKLMGEATVIDFKEYDLPHTNAGFLGKDNLTPFQEKLIHSIGEADLLFVLTPEYNWFPSSELVNMVHHLASRTHAHLFDHMAVAFLGVSSGRGGRMPAVQLSYVFDKIFNTLDLSSITSPKKFESHYTPSCIDEEGNLLDNEEFNKGFRHFVQYSINVANRWQLDS